MNIRSALRIMVRYCCKGHWHEPEIKRFLQSRRYIFLQGIMKLHGFQKLFDLNQLDENFFRWKRVTLRFICDQFNCQSLHRHGSGPCGRN